MVKVLFVCLGNICRSPMAEGVFTHLVEQQGLTDQIEIDSAGTGGYHVGEKADPRMRQVAAFHGIDLTSRARKFECEDLDEFDYIVAMDGQNFEDIMSLASGNHRAKVVKMRDYDDFEKGGDVPDPYYGGDAGFENVYQILLRSNNVFLNGLKSEYEF